MSQETEVVDTTLPIIEEKPRIRILIDVDSEKPTENSVHIEGNCGVLADILVQLFEHPSNKGIVSVFEVAVADYYAKHPDEYEK